MAKARYTPAPKIDRRALAWILGFVAVLALITISGIGRVNAAHDMRGLYGTLGDVQRTQDRLLEEHSRLMLERGALTSMQNIETVAQTELGMQFPDDVAQVLE